MAESTPQLPGCRNPSSQWSDPCISHCRARAEYLPGPLHLSFYACQVLLFRGLMYPATRAAKATPGSNLQRWLSTTLSEFEQFANFVNHITGEDLNGFWGRRKLTIPRSCSWLTDPDTRSQFILCGNFLIYLFLMATDPRDVQTAYRLLEQFHQSIQRFGNIGDEATKPMLRPVMVRIESFFAQASELIQHGRVGLISPQATHS